jgi:hypothetical protein
MKPRYFSGVFIISLVCMIDKEVVNRIIISEERRQAVSAFLQDCFTHRGSEVKILYRPPSSLLKRLH